MELNKTDYINALKDLRSREKKVKVESKEHVLMEQNKIEIRENANIIQEIFIQSSEIEALPAGDDRDMQILRLSIIAELDASNLYEKLALLANNEDVKTVLLDISKEEKVHVGEFEALLQELDSEYEDAQDEGSDEVNDLTD